MTDPTRPTDLGALREIEDRMRARLAVLETKSERLQRRLRLMGYGFTFVLALLALGIVRPDLFGLDYSRDLLETQRIRLLDVEGRPRGEWGVDERGDARLTLMDRQGRQRLNLTVLQSGFPGIALANETGQRRAVLGLLPDQTTTLVFADSRGVPRAVLGLTNADEANLVFADARGESQIGMGLDSSGIGSVMMPSDSTQTPAPRRPGGSR